MLKLSEGAGVRVSRALGGDNIIKGQSLCVVAPMGERRAH